MQETSTATRTRQPGGADVDVPVSLVAGLIVAVIAMTVVALGYAVHVAGRPPAHAPAAGAADATAVAPSSR